ncbi:hypothetical protein, partial [Saccharothrix coeruleofusca]
PAGRPTADEVRSRLKEIVGDWEPPAVERPARAPRRRLLARIAAAFVLVVAISTAVVIRQHQVPAAQQQASAGGLIGDERTADPCALIDEEELSRFGTVRVVTDYGNFNRCDALVHVGAKEPVDIEIQLITRASRTVQGQPLEVVEEPLRSNECDRTVVADERYAVRVSAKLDNPPLDLCPLADAAAATVLEVLRGGQIPRRATPFPEDSLARVDACALLDDEVLTAVAGVNGGSALNVFGNWACKWRSTTGGLGINLRYDQHSADEVPKGELTRLEDGRVVYVWLDTDSSKSCTIHVPHLPASPAKRAYLDVLVLTVQGDRSGEEYCLEAKILAAAAAKKLPS